MVSSKSILSFLLVALSIVDAYPLRRAASTPTLSLFAKVDTAGAINHIAPHKARAEALRQGSLMNKRSIFNVAVNSTSVSYTTEVGIGTPATQYTLLVDTGSSNTWVGAQKSNPYKITSTSVDTGVTLRVPYVGGSFIGREYLDTVTFGSGLSVQSQGLGSATSIEGFKSVDGVLGLGLVSQTVSSTSDHTEIPTVTDNLYSQGLVDFDAFGVYLVPSGTPDTTGELNFGGADISKTTSTVNYVPLTTTAPSSDYWGIDMSIEYGEDIILAETAGIVDTGSTDILMASDAFNKYVAATGASIDSTTGRLKITTAQYANLKTLTCTIGQAKYVLTPNAQIWPRSLNSDIGGEEDEIYLVVADIGSDFGAGLDFVLGHAFLQRFYTVFDTTGHRFGVATTKYTDAISN